MVDTSVWVEHPRVGDDRLATLLESGTVLVHTWVVGELALGHLSRASEVLDLLDQLPQAPMATPAEVRTLIRAHGLAGSGIGFIDAQLVASTLLTPGVQLWTLDQPLATVVARLGREHVP